MIHLDDVRHQVRRSNELWHDKTRQDKAVEVCIRVLVVLIVLLSRQACVSVCVSACVCRYLDVTGIYLT